MDIVHYPSDSRFEGQMTLINIDFSWQVGSKYEIFRPSPEDMANPHAAIREPVILQVGPVEEDRQPLIRNPLMRNSALYSAFANLKKQQDFEKACLSFAYTYGLPTQIAEDGAKERLSVWRDLVERMSDSIDGLRLAKNENALPSIGAAITEIEVRVLPGQDGLATLALRPPKLWEAMRLQLGQSITSGKSIEVCQNCQRWFETGGGRGNGARRRDAKFCSEDCRKNSHSNHSIRGAQ
jgi:hypothetical protein